jgi:hypothetical protein
LNVRKKAKKSAERQVGYLGFCFVSFYYTLMRRFKLVLQVDDIAGAFATLAA